MSEASRHIPDAWNVIRHAYDHVDLRILWEIYEHDLASLDDALRVMLASHGPKDRTS